MQRLYLYNLTRRVLELNAKSKVGLYRHKKQSSSSEEGDHCYVISFDSSRI